MSPGFFTPGAPSRSRFPSGRSILCLLVAVALSSALDARASTSNTFQGNNGLWATAANWTAGHIPTASEDVIFTTNANYTITVPAGALANSLTCNSYCDFYGGDLTLTTGKINVITNGYVTIHTTVLAGSAGLTFNSTAPTTGYTGELVIESACTYTGTTTISNGALVITGSVAVGTNGPLGNSATAIVLGDASTATTNGSPYLSASGAPNISIGRNITVGNFTTTGVYSIGGIIISGNIAINQPLTLGGSIGGAITSAVAGTHVITMTGTAVSGVIGGGTGTLAVVIASGSSTSTLSGANTFTGGVTLNSGTLDVESSGALGSAAVALVINGGTIEGGVAITNPTTINADFSANTVAFNGTVTLGTTAGPTRTITVNPFYTATFNGVISNGTNGTPATSLGKSGMQALWC